MANQGTQVIVDDLDALLEILPPDIRDALNRLGRRDELLEVILDLGRIPTARFTTGEIALRSSEVTCQEIEHVDQQIGEFDADNRGGIQRTLHRISAIRNRRAEVVGLTCRVGRAVFGTITIIQDLIESGKSVLLLGRPAVGKTTMLREAARVLAENKRVIIVDTSNEIGGDGDIPHPAVGRARRMQVRLPNLQHEVMIEAVENHNPEVIVIDEIGRELEAAAARTIAERGVQLIATAHGNSLENLMLNPTLADLIGGIESVTLSDEEARRRGTQKVVLERRAPPTFDILVEIQDRQRVLVHEDVATSVDAILRGQDPNAQLRYRDAAGAVHSERVITARWNAGPDNGGMAPQGYGGGAGDFRGGSGGDFRGRDRDRGEERRDLRGGARGRRPEIEPTVYLPVVEEPAPAVSSTPMPTRAKAIYPFGVARNRLQSAAQSLGAPVRLVDGLEEAEVLLTSKQFYRQRPGTVAEAERRNIPVYVLRGSTSAQMEAFLTDLFDLPKDAPDSFGRAMREAEVAVQRVLEGADSVELSPQSAFIRRYQHEMARAAHLESNSFGKEPHRRVRIFRER